MAKQTGLHAQKTGGLEDSNGNPGRVSIPSRDAALPAKPAGSARVSARMAPAKPTDKRRSGQVTAECVEIWSDEEYARATGLVQILDEHLKAVELPSPAAAAGPDGAVEPAKK